jgi:hypothetical protein
MSARVTRLFQLDLHNVDLFGLRIQNAGELHFLSLIAMHQICAIEPENIFARNQDQVASQASIQ